LHALAAARCVDGVGDEGLERGLLEELVHLLATRLVVVARQHHLLAIVATAATRAEQRHHRFRVLNAHRGCELLLEVAATAARRHDGRW